MASMAAALGLLMALVLCEAALRVYVAARGWTANCYAASLDLFRPSEELGYELRPGFKLRSGVYRISINRLGFRGPHFEMKKPAGTVRVALLGESSAFGYFVSDGQEAARLLEARLRAEGPPVEVINAGVPGYNLYQTIHRYEDVVAPLDPDVVVLYLGWNDLGYVVSDEPDADRFRRRPVASPFERFLGKSVLYGFVGYRLLGESADPAPADLECAIPTEAGKRAFHVNLDRLIQSIKSKGKKLVICSQATAARNDAEPALKEALARDAKVAGEMVELGAWLNSTLEATAKEHSAVFIDVNAAIPPTREWLVDYVHLTVKGEERLATVLAERLRTITK